MSAGKLWELEPLDLQDQAIVEAYVRTGVPVDRLPYTAEFDRMFDSLAGTLALQKSDAAKHQVLMRLLTLRKRGRLPAVMVRPVEPVATTPSKSA